MKVFIEIDGGMLVDVTTDNPDVVFVLKDWDNSPDPAIPYEPKVVSAQEVQALITKHSDTTLKSVPDDTEDTDTPEP